MDLNLSEGLQIRAFQKYIFNSRKQEDNETIEDFANTLTRLGANIGAEEQTIVDRFIAGLKNDSARLGILQVGFLHIQHFHLMQLTIHILQIIHTIFQKYINPR